MLCRVADAVQETCSSEMLGGQGADFLRGVTFWSIRSSDLLRWLCVTGVALRMTWHHFFVAGAATLDRWSGKFAKRIGTRPSALHLTFQYWRKSRRIASFLMLSTSKMEEVSYNSLVFDVVTFKQWGNLAELLRFWRCQLRKIEEVSQNSFVFKLAGDTTLRYTTLRYPPLPQLQLQYKYKSYTTLITLHYATTATTTTITTATTTTLHYNTLH